MGCSEFERGRVGIGGVGALARNLQMGDRKRKPKGECDEYN